MGKKIQTDNILWASYGPDVSESLMKYGIYLAGLFETGIESLYVIPTTYNEEKYDYFTELEKKLNAEWTELTAKENLDKLKSLQKIIQSTNIKTSDKIQEGVPCHEIIKFINEQPVSMIVMGRGMKMGGNYILQKTTHYVIKNSTVPVFIADSSNEIRDIKNILVPVFQNQINSRSLKFALNIAGKIGNCSLTILNINNPSLTPEETERKHGDAYFNLSSSVIKNKNINTVVIDNESISGGIIDYVNDHETDLIVIETYLGDKKKVFHSEGSIAEEILKMTDCPLVTVRAE